MKDTEGQIQAGPWDYCPKCGAQAGAGRCGSCGYQLSGRRQMPTVRYEAKEGPHRAIKEATEEA